MGIIRTHLRLANDAKPELEEIEAEALVETGALHLCIPEHVAIQLQLRTLETPRSDSRRRQTASGCVRVAGAHRTPGPSFGLRGARFGQSGIARIDPDGRYGSDRRTRAPQGVRQSASAEYSDVGGDGEPAQIDPVPPSSFVNLKTFLSKHPYPERRAGQLVYRCQYISSRL